jgi:trans-2,3-dihydro-3-hydroxyanthranilate isomerase
MPHRPRPHSFRIINVFTVSQDPFSGNPLCVFEDAEGMTDAQMQALARQMNLSETTFILPSKQATARVRIFTPSYEMPFAGHPTLGTAQVVRSLKGGDRLTLEMKAGLIDVTAAGERWTLKAAQAPRVTPPEASRAELGRMLGLPEDAVSDQPLWVNTGVEQLIIPVSSPKHVRAAQPVPELLARYGVSETQKDAMAYLWARDGDKLSVRFFFAQLGAVLEDPATGSACANLGGWMIAIGKSLPFSARLRQGDEIQRPSELELRVDSDKSIYVSGSVYELGRGEIHAL